MFKREVKPIGDLLKEMLRKEGLETPLLQRRIVDAWDEVMGHMISSYTREKFIRNQVLHVKIDNPALRQDLSMMHTQITRRLNDAVGSSVISDVRVY
jgi:predicted nucleic acid-binding Zn ribbon protein